MQNSYQKKDYWKIYKKWQKQATCVKFDSPCNKQLKVESIFHHKILITKDDRFLSSVTEDT